MTLRYAPFGLIFLLIIITAIPTSVQAIDLRIDGIEVTQSVQCFDSTTGYTSCPDNSLELTSGKPIAIRVYINHDGEKCANGIPDKVVETGVPVTVSWLAGHKGETEGQVPTVIVKNFDVPCSTNIDNLRNDESAGGERGSVVVIIPGDTPSLRKDSWLWVQAEIATTKNGVTIDPNPSNNQKEIMLGNSDPANFQPGVILRAPKKVAWIVVKNKYTGTASEKYAAQGGILMQRMYPFPVYYYKAGPTLDWSCQECICSYLGCIDLANKLSEYKTLMKPEPDALLGWVAPGLVGEAAGAGKHFTKTGWAEARSDKEFTNMIGAHEVGHMLGSNDHCDEWGCSKKIEETGFYLMPSLTFTASEVVPKNTADFMKGYPSTPAWISPMEYNMLLGNGKMDCPSVSSSSAKGSLSASGTATMGSSPSASGSGPISTVLVNGIASYDGQHYSGMLKPTFTLNTEGPFLENDVSGDYCIQFVDPSGPMVGEKYCFKNHGQNAVDGPAVSTIVDDGNFAFKLQLPSGATGIQLLHEDEVLATQMMSTNTPIVTWNQPVGGTLDDKVTVSWTGTDNDNDPLTYNVLYSPDQGSSWTPLATYTPDTSCMIDPTNLAGGTAGLIRVMASDGFNTATIDSAPLQISDKNPEVFIAFPSDEAAIPITQYLGFSAVTQDLEDGIINEGQIVWTSDGNDQLGTGSDLWLDPGRLSSGNHIIMVTATDSAHQSASATVEITITQAPIITWTNPADIVYGTPLSSTQLNAVASVPGTFKYTPAAGTVLNAGNNQNIHVDFTPADSAHYNSASKDVTINVSKATPTLTWTNPADIISGTPLSSAQLNAVASVPGTFKYTPAAGTVLNAGNNQNLHVDFTPTDITNNNMANKDVKINVLIPMKTKIVPSTLNIGRKGYFIAFVTVPNSYKAADVTATSVMCNGAPALKIVRIKFFPQIFVAIFSREKLVNVKPGDKVQFIVTGTLTKNGQKIGFSGTDSIKVIKKPSTTKEDTDDVMKMADEKIFTKFNMG